MKRRDDPIGIDLLTKFDRNPRLHGGGGSSSSSRAAASLPRQATSEADIALQRGIMNNVHHEAHIVIDFLEPELGIAEAHEVEGGKPVSLTWNTIGFAPESLKVGDQVRAFVTALQVAVRVEAPTT